MNSHQGESSGCGCGKSPGRCRADGVVRAAVALLDQCASFVAALPDPVFTADSSRIRGGTIGKHVRHILDHYDAILVGVEAEAVIDYDHRERDVPMEARRAAAVENITRARHQLMSLTPPQLDGPARIRVMLAADGSETELLSTVARELAFATHHAVHHHAMIRAIAEEHGVAPGAEFGKAPSTLNYEYRSGASAGGRAAWEGSAG